MECLNTKNSSEKFDSTLGELSISYRHENALYDSNALKRAWKHLVKEKKKKRNTVFQCCSVRRCTNFKVDRQIKLKCRQLPNVVEHLRKAVMRQDWDEATTLAMLLCYPGLRYYSSIIVKVCFILLLSHPNSSFSLMQNFIRHATGYILEEDVNKYIKILLSIRTVPLERLKIGKYARKTGDYKVIWDPQFDKL